MSDIDGQRIATASGALSHDDIVAAAAGMVPALRDRAQGADAARRVPDETMAEVGSADILRAMVPSRYGGHGLGLRTVSELAQVMARGCPSTAWVVGFLVEHNWQFARFPQVAQDLVFGAEPYIRAPAQLQPAGTVRPVPDGFRLSGRWPFCSGVDHSEWAILAAMRAGDSGGGGDRSTALVCMVPLRELTVLDDWHTAGMRATGSHTVVAEDVFVPDHLVVSFSAFASEDNPGAQLHAETVLRYPLAVSLTVFAASVAVGAAAATVDSFAEQMTSRVLFATAGDTPATRPKSQARLADAKVTARAAELLWRDALDLVCSVNDAGERMTVEQRAWARLLAGRAVLTARDAISAVCDGAGARAYYEGSPLQRFQRDIETMKGHVVFDVDRSAVTFGRVALGLEPGDLV